MVAVQVLQGTSLNGNAIETDSWERAKKSGGGGRKFKIWGRKKKKGDVKTGTSLWVGDLPAGATREDLKAHVDKITSCTWTQVYDNKGKGTGAIGFASGEEATQALTLLMKRPFKGTYLSFDKWEK